MGGAFKARAVKEACQPIRLKGCVSCKGPQACYHDCNAAVRSLKRLQAPACMAKIWTIARTHMTIYMTMHDKLLAPIDLTIDM